jgi:hypothetical protein
MTTKPVMSMIACKAALDAITALVTATAIVRILTGAQPATTLTGQTGTLLSTLNMNATPFPTNSTSGTSDGNATATANAISSDTNAAASGTAGYFRILNGSSVVIFQGNVGTSGADLNFNTTTINAGDTVSITSFKVTNQCGDGTS